MVHVDDLAELSPCDVRAETAPAAMRVGTLASPMGYPQRQVIAPFWHDLDATDVREITVRDSTDFIRLRRTSDRHHRTLKPDPALIRAFTGDSTYENEVHDCQRLVVSDADTLVFGPLVALVPLHDATNESSDAPFDNGLPVATIYNWGGFRGETQTYETLGVSDEWNCLFIRRTGDDDWRASVRRLEDPSEDHSCEHETAPDDDAAYFLSAERLLHDNVPATARWEFDNARSVHLIGIRCGTAWCRIGPPPLDPNGQPRWSRDPIHVTGDARTEIPGYFDAQHLAIPDGPGRIKPGPWSVVVPDTGFFRRAMAQIGNPVDQFGSFGDPGGLVVADVNLAYEVQPYTDKMALHNAEATVSVAIPATVDAGEAVFESDAASSTLQIKAMYTNELGGAEEAGHVTYMSQGLHGAKGAVRWRWHDTMSTESIWSCCNKFCDDCCDSN